MTRFEQALLQEFVCVWTAAFQRLTAAAQDFRNVVLAGRDQEEARQRLLLASHRLYAVEVDWLWFGTWFDEHLRGDLPPQRAMLRDWAVAFAITLEKVPQAQASAAWNVCHAAMQQQ